MIDVALAIDEEAVIGQLTIQAPATYDSGGNAVPGASTTTSISLTFQPVTGSRLLDIPEGVRSEVSIVIWTRAAVEIENVITVDSVNYRVAHTWPRRRSGFTKAALRRLKA